MAANPRGAYEAVRTSVTDTIDTIFGPDPYQSGRAIGKLGSEILTTFALAGATKAAATSKLAKSLRVRVGSLAAVKSTAGKAIVNLSDDAFVRFDPSRLDNVIVKGGIQSRFFGQGKVWLAKYGDVKNVIKASDLETVLYRKNLWPTVRGKFSGGATLRVIRNVNDAIPAGVTNRTNGIRQWYIRRNIDPRDIEVIRRLRREP